MKNLVTLLFLSLSFLFGQENKLATTDSLKHYEGKVVAVYTDSYMKEYNRLKFTILKVYPYALYAADLLDELENNAENIEKRRKKNKFYKNAYKGLKEDFKYVLLDLYQSEGRMLMKLVHRETGMTVYEIAEKYRGKGSAETFELMGKIWNQDVNIKFDKNGKDKIAEHVVSDIEKGIIDFDPTVKLVTKDDYKEGMKEYKETKKSNKKRRKEREKKERKQKREKKKKN